MNITEKIRSYWHVPTSVIAFQKYLLDNRGISLLNNLDVWKEEILKIESLSEEEQTLLEIIMNRIDDTQTEYHLDVLYSLIKDTYIRYGKNNRYVLLKYMDNVTYEDVWNNWYAMVRGVVVDMDEIEVATATMSKFYNVNEKPHTSLASVQKKIEKGKTIKYIKQDGSNINISHKRDLLITTPGSFDSKQTVWAKKMLENRFQTFLEDHPVLYSNYTFIFEYVGPENRIVVMYPQSDLILLQIRDNETGAYLPHELVFEIAEKYGFTPCETVDLTIEQILKDKDDPEIYKADEQEGWVIRIDQGEETFLVKLKCSDYVQLHRMIANALNPKWIFEAINNGTFDDKIASIDSEDIKKIVSRVASKIHEWGEKKKEEFLSLLASFPKEQWGEEDTLKRYRKFHNEVMNRTDGIEKEERIRKFLDSFSKGKLTDPKEEILMKAEQLYQENLLDLSKLEDFDAYKSFVIHRVDDWIKHMKKAIENYVFNGVVDDDFDSFLEEHFEGLKNIGENVENLEEWEELFAKNKDEYYRYVMIQKDKLRSEYFAISDYAKKKNEATLKKNELTSFYRKKANEYLFRESTHKLVEQFMQKEWIIDDEWHRYYVSKKELEEVKVKELFPEADQQTIDQIIREYYFMARGHETDRSYEKAQEIFIEIDESLRNQKKYYQEKGKFSAYVNRNIPSFFREFFFQLFEHSALKRKEIAREMNFIPYANIVVDPSKETLEELDIDFRDIQEFTKDLAVKDE